MYRLNRSVRRHHRRHRNPSVRTVYVAARRHIRRHRNPGALRSLESTFRETFSKNMLMTAGGAVAASFGTGYVLNKWGASLPLANNQYGKLIYILGLPVAVAGLIGKKQPAVAQGLIIGGLVMSVNSLITAFKGTTATTPTALGRYAVAGQVGPGMFAAYPQRMANPAAALGGSNTAFPASAWS